MELTERRELCSSGSYGLMISSLGSMARGDVVVGIHDRTYDRTRDMTVNILSTGLHSAFRFIASRPTKVDALPSTCSSSR